MTYNNGHVYDGEWKEDMKHGKGKMIYKNGNVYEGEWYKDHKKGILSVASYKISSMFSSKRRPSSKRGGYKRKTRRNHNTRN